MTVSDVYSSITAAKIDWIEYLANPRYIRKDYVICWEKYEKIWISDTNTAADFISLVDNGQYSLQISEDGGIIQLYYKFDALTKKLESANLAYFGPPQVAADIYDSEDIEIHKELLVPEEIDQIIDADDGEELSERLEREPFTAELVPWLRIDYDPSAKTGILHGECHMHINGLPGVRILVYGVPSPVQFIEWIMSLFYPNIYKKHRLHEDGRLVKIDLLKKINTSSISFTKSDAYIHMPHIVIPFQKES